MTPTDPEQVVRALMNGLAPDRATAMQTMATYLHPDFIWDNVGYKRTRGFAAAAGVFADFEAALPMAYMTVDIVTLAVNGPHVLTERVDHFHRPDHSIGLSVRVMGVFEVVDGKIVHWRDYCDFTPFKVNGAA